MPHPLERRQRQRYAIQFEVHFAVRSEGKTVSSGEGVIRNASSEGLFFQTDQSLPVGSDVHLVAKWPVRFRRTTRIDWIVEGHVVRSDPRGAAVEILNQHLERRSRRKTERLAG